MPVAGSHAHAEVTLLEKSHNEALPVQSDFAAHQPVGMAMLGATLLVLPKRDAFRTPVLEHRSSAMAAELLWEGSRTAHWVTHMPSLEQIAAGRSAIAAPPGC